MAQKYKFGNKIWANKEGSTLAYNDENENYKPLPFNFTRGSIATRVNKAGLIEVVGNDKPRIDYTDSADGVLLLENSSTNSLPYSNEFSNSDWSKNSSGIDTSIGNNGINENIGISPDGSLNADRVNFLLQSDLDIGIGKSISSSSGTTWSASMWIKGEGSNIDKNISFRLKRSSGGTFIGNDGTIKLTSEWVRIEINPLTLIANNNGVRLILSSNDATSCLVYGAQLEANSIASSYIPTNGSVVTRAAETCNNSGNSEVFNDSEGVLFADISALANDGTFRMIGLFDEKTTNEDRIQIYYRSDDNKMSFLIEANNTNQFIKTLDVNTIQYNKVALKYGDTSKVYINGFKLAEESGVSISNNLQRLSFNEQNGGNNFYGKTKEIAYYDAVLTDAELETLTSYRSLSEMVTELNLNTL